MPLQGFQIKPLLSVFRYKEGRETALAIEKNYASIAPKQNIQAPVQNIQTPVRNIQAPVQHIQAPVQIIQAPVQNIQAPVQNIRAPVQNIQAPAQTPAQAHTPQRIIQSPL